MTSNQSARNTRVNFSRVQTYGEGLVHSVKVRVDPNSQISRALPFLTPRDVSPSSPSRHFVATHALNQAAVEQGLRLLIDVRGQRTIRRLRGKVKWTGDLASSRLGRVGDR